jgi:hypothetical protein
MKAAKRDGPLHDSRKAAGESDFSRLGVPGNPGHRIARHAPSGIQSSQKKEAALVGGLFPLTMPEVPRSTDLANRSAPVRSNPDTVRYRQNIADAERMALIWRKGRQRRRGSKKVAPGHRRARPRCPAAAGKIR